MKVVICTTDLTKVLKVSLSLVIGHPQQFDQASESRVFRAVLYHCALVLGGPIVAFFGTKTLLLGPIFQWDSEGTTTDVVSAIVAGSHY